MLPSKKYLACHPTIYRIIHSYTHTKHTQRIQHTQIKYNNVKFQHLEGIIAGLKLHHLNVQETVY